MASFMRGVGLVLLLPATLLAQEGTQLPSKGSLGLSFALPDGGGVGFGVRRMLSSSTNLGLNIQFDLDRTDRNVPTGPQDERTSFGLGFGPEVRRYFSRPGPVRPYLHVGAAVLYRRAEAVETQSEWWLGTSLGVGAEWFPTTGVSVSGATGVDVGYRASDLGVGGDGRYLRIALYRSELLLNLYF